MNRNFGVGFVIFCFGLSTVNVAALADQIVEVQPIIVQPYEIQELNQQMIDRDRQNRDEEISIKQLIEKNNELIQTTLAHQQDEGLAKIDQTMLSYRDTLLSRDRARIVANGEKGWSSRYGDLIALTEDADSMTVHQDLEDRSGLISEKYQMLTELKDEMTALNEKLTGQQVSAADQKTATLNGFQKTAQDQQDKIQILVGRLGEMDKRIAKYDEIIAQKDQQIAQLKENLSVAQNELAVLKQQSKETPPSGVMALPPVIVNTPNNQPQAVPSVNPLLAAKDAIIKEKQGQVDLLKSELENNLAQGNNKSPQDAIIKEKQDQVDLLKSELEAAIAQGNNQSPKDEIIKKQENEIAILKAQAQELSSKEGQIKAQADQMARVSEQFKNNSDVYAHLKDQVLSLRNIIRQQDLDLKAKNDSIRWLHQVLDATKNKAEYYQLTSKINQIPVKQVQEEMQNIKDDFARRFKDYDQFEHAIASLKDQVSQLGVQLSQKQDQVNLLKSELANKITDFNNQGRQDAQIQQDLKAQLQDKENQIVKMKADILAILQAQADKEIYRRNARAQVDDRVKLAQQLIDLQAQEAALLDEKSNLEAAQNALFDQHAMGLETKIKALLAQHQLQTVDLENRMQELKAELSQKEGQVDLLETELKNKIAEEKNQSVLADQIQDLKAQLQDKEDQIATMKTQLQAGEETQDEADSLKQQLAATQDKADQLKQQLDSKTAQSDQMTAMMGDYQKKLESKDNAYNEQSGQIADLNAQLQEKEAQVVKIKKDMYDLQEAAEAKDRDAQAKDLSLSMVQERMMDEKINEYQDKVNGLQATNVRQVAEVTNLKAELALARQELEGMPSSDEIEFLRAGLKKATAELKQKNDMLLQIKANADEYVKEFKEQSQEFQSLKEQLLDAQNQIQRKDEDLKYKDMAITRLKGLSKTGESDLKAQVIILTHRLDIAEKKLMGKTHENKVEALQAQLKSADVQIKALQAQLNQLGLPTNNDALQEKLKQALDKIDEQGRLISVLAQKLQDAGQSVDLAKDAGK